jgi:hypothetical protein
MAPPVCKKTDLGRSFPELNVRPTGGADFLTWFEFAPEHEALFDDLPVRLRQTREWSYASRAIDIGLTRTA